MLFSKNPDDIQRFVNMPADRRRLIDESPAAPVTADYAVNKLSRSLHPLYVWGKIVAITPAGRDCKTLRLQSMSQSGRFPYFSAGQYVTLSANVGSSFICRPYSVSSSPKEATKGILEVTVQQRGVFSTYLTTQAKVGDVLLVGEPDGAFYYDSLRDRRHIVAIAGGSGVTPFISMVKSLQEGSDDFDLTLIYGAKTRKDLLIDYGGVKCGKVKLAIVLSDEKIDGYEHGLISAAIINKYAPSDYSLFMCGPNALYDYVAGEIPKLINAPRSVRRDHNCIGDRTAAENRTFKLTVHIRDSVTVIPARENETLATAMERAGLRVPLKCRAGGCGYCHSRLIAGEYFVNPKDEHRRKADLKFGYIHPCCTYPCSDMEIDVPPLPFEEAKV